MGTTKQTKMANYNMRFDRIEAAVLYLTKHDGRGGRQRPLSPRHQSRKFVTWTPEESRT